MARSIRAPRLENRTSRLRLRIRRKPYWVAIAPGVGLGYRRNDGAGVWSVRSKDSLGAWPIRKFAVADDFEDSNGDTVLTYFEAQHKARELTRGSEDGAGRPLTIATALDAYEAALAARGADGGNATRVRFHLSDALAGRLVGVVTARELRTWRDGLIKRGVSPATADRVGRTLAAVLNQAAHDDPRVAGNSAAWRTGLRRLPNADRTRGEAMVLPDDTVRAIVAKAYELAGPQYGLLVELLATLGARASQLLALTVGDFQPAIPRLLMPSSRKGKGRKVERRPLPVSPSLAAKLRMAAGDRPAHERLLLDAAGAPWRWVDLRTWRRLTAVLGLDPALVPYCLRHSAIVRSILAGVPLRLVAASADTSTSIIERVYGRYVVGDASDAVLRRAQLDLGAPPIGDTVVPLRRG